MKSKLQVKKEIEKEINEYFENKLIIERDKVFFENKLIIERDKVLTYKGHTWTYWHNCHAVAEAKLSQLKEDAKEELSFLERFDNLERDKRIKELKEVLL